EIGRAKAVPAVNHGFDLGNFHPWRCRADWWAGLRRASLRRPRVPVQLPRFAKQGLRSPRFEAARGTPDFRVPKSDSAPLRESRAESSCAPAATTAPAPVFRQSSPLSSIRMNISL